MCGITGFTGPGGECEIRAMTDALWHRGPDDGHIYRDGMVSLGHRRLSIVDLECGLQPMRDPQSGYIIVYNGEIYNHPLLRSQLEKLGRVFRSSHSDTETVLLAFAQWGPACFAMFNGMFACAIYHPEKRKIWLARDRFGEKPLFYARHGKFLAFASEIIALRHWSGFDSRFDEENIQRFFSWNYLPGSSCVHKNCASLPPGSWAELDLDNGELAISTYWRFELNPDSSLADRHEGELVEEFRRLLCQAVDRRLLADVPVGIFLSGGLDSSAILAAACHASDPGAIRSFTIGFREKSFDESAKAALVAKALGVRNDVEYLTEEAMTASIGDILGRMSEPFGDASLIPTSHLAQFARRHVKVALSGDGGDELLGGYDPLDAMAPARLYRKIIPGAMHSLLRRIMDKWPASDKNMSPDFKIKRFLRGLTYPAAIQLPAWMSGLEPAEILEFFENPLPADVLYADAQKLYGQNSGASDMEQAFLFFTSIYLPNDILVKSDRAAMMHSLESRAVFLDNDLVDFCRKLPMRFKYRKGQRKYILRKALEGWLPANILAQPKKGFGIPLNRWLRSLRAIETHVPGLKDGVQAACERKHRRRAGDYRFFLWDLQAFGRME